MSGVGMPAAIHGRSSQRDRYRAQVDSPVNPWLSSTPQVRAVSMWARWRIVTEPGAPVSSSSFFNWQEGVTLHIVGSRAVGQSKVEASKKNGPRTLEFNLGAAWMYSKFLWSVQTRKGWLVPSSKWHHSSSVSLNACYQTWLLLFISACKSCWEDKAEGCIFWLSTNRW